MLQQNKSMKKYFFILLICKLYTSIAGRLTSKLCVTVLLIAINSAAISQISLQNLRCEMRSNPLGIDVTLPRLSWEIQSGQRNTQQTAYEILVASSKEKAAANMGDLWTSGKINSNQSIHIKYNGKTLQSRTTCFWKVRVYTNNGISAWSNTAYFTIGLLNKNDWQAKWVGYDKTSPWDSMNQHARLSARYLRKEFQSSSSIKNATVYIVGLGLYELFINGSKVGNNVLAPAPTDYRKTVLYNTYDVTSMLHNGNNAIGATLGNGRFFYMQQKHKVEKLNTFGFPKLLLQLEIEYANGTKQIIVSDETWKLNIDGAIRTANEYDGEEYDATKELTGWNNSSYNDSKWLTPELVKEPDGTIRSQMSEPMKVMKTIKPVSIKKRNNGTYILDMGQNFAGWLQIRVRGKRGNKVTLRFAESLQNDGSLYTANLRSANQTDVYTVKGGETETWHPSFVYHGFRYAEITNYPGNPTINDFEGQLVYDAFNTIGSLQTSDTIINKIVKNAWWGIASNYKGVPIDCPQRDERQPWLGDRTTGSYGESFVFDNAKIYAKWLNDMEDAQTEQGTIPDIVPPYKKYYGDNVTWPATYFTVAEMLYRQFGDKEAIIKHYASMKKWMMYMKDKYMKDYIISKDSYGDWCVPPESLELIHAKDSSLNTNGALIATAYYYRLLHLMKAFAVISNNSADTTYYLPLAENIKASFNAKFYNSDKKCYDNNTVTANLLPLCFGIAAAEDQQSVFDNIYKKIEQNNFHIGTGVIGTQWLMRTLTQFNRADIAYRIASNKTYPGWGYMVESGATTIWELWNGKTANPQMNSQNHVMLLGDFLIWLYENVGGIKSDDKEVAFKKIVMKPEMIAGLDSAMVTYHSLYGDIVSDWKKDKDIFSWHIVIPGNTTAQIEIPVSDSNPIRESGKSIANESYIQILSRTKTTATLIIGSGSYHFQTQNSQ